MSVHAFELVGNRLVLVTKEPSRSLACSLLGKRIDELASLAKMRGLGKQVRRAFR